MSCVDKLSEVGTSIHESNDAEEFWRYRQGPEWDDGWEIIPNPERSVG